jgi:hypothetical protein
MAFWTAIYEYLEESRTFIVGYNQFIGPRTVASVSEARRQPGASR